MSLFPRISGVCGLGLLAVTLVSAQETSQRKPLEKEPPAASEPAAPLPLAPITISRKPGDEDGEAEIVYPKGKLKRVAPHAVAAWRVRGEEGALVIVVEKAKKDRPTRYMLRYYDLDSGRRRVLGPVPFNTATVAETENEDESWAFCGQRHRFSGTADCGRRR